MATVDLRPASNVGTPSGWNDGTSAFDYTLVNEDIETGSPDTDYAGNGNNTGSARVKLDAAPAASAINSLTLKYRRRCTGWADDFSTLHVVVYADDGTTVLYTASTEDGNILPTSFATRTSSGFSATVAQVDGGIEVELVGTKSSTGMPDALVFGVSAVEVVLDYDPPVEPAVLSRLPAVVPSVPVQDRSRW